MRFTKFVLILSFIFCTTNSLAAPVAARPQVAVVLAGDTARALSHIGLLKALEEHGIPIDMLVGTSTGGITAGLYAAGLSVQNLQYVVTHVDISRFFTPNIPPKGGFVQTDEFERFVDLLTDNARLEELPIPFYSVVTNVVTGEEVALHNGSLARGVVAAMSIPGMFPPVNIDGNHFVDGGLLSPVPVHIARAYGADFVIAVDVGSPFTDIDHDNVFTNVHLTLAFLRDQAEPDVTAADVVINPGVGESSYMEFDRAAEFIDEGYQATRDAIQLIREALLALDPDFPFAQRPPQAGLSPAAFARRVTAAVNSAQDVADVGPSIRPELELHADVRLSASIPIGRLRNHAPISVRYTLAADGTPAHTLAFEAGNCATNCVSVFGREVASNKTWLPGASVTGSAGNALRYTLAWQASPVPTSQWNAALSTPTPSAITTKGYEITLQARQDPEGMHGRPTERPQADVLYRHYFLGPRKNHWELLRGSANWYVGGGLKAAFEDRTFVAPLGEVGVLLEGRLLGLYALRSRISATYDGSDDTWTFRWIIGD